ncbi:MAG: protein TolQ [Deltaproteobacteria bacterium]|nr:protein TolQ [Deltaproteobacteria bacterium]MBW2134821.1 protein TolQ [Deltaproteobacteria bacterium]
MDISIFFPLISSTLTSAVAAASTSDLDILPIVQAAGPMVKGVMLVLLFFSIVCWAIIFAKLVLLTRAKKQTMEFLEIFWSAKNLSTAYHDTRHLRASPVAEIYRLGYIELGKLRQTKTTLDNPGHETQASVSLRAGLDNVSRALRRAISAETTRLSRALTFLATTGNTAPFIGLFGTVWGIMNAFRGISLKGSATLSMVAPGIAEALIATAAGLAAAIPAVIAYNYFLSKVRVLEAEMGNFAADLLNIIERDLLRRVQPREAQGHGRSEL